MTAEKRRARKAAYARAAREQGEKSVGTRIRLRAYMRSLLPALEGRRALRPRARGDEDAIAPSLLRARQGVIRGGEEIVGPLRARQGQIRDPDRQRQRPHRRLGRRELSQRGA